MHSHTKHGSLGFALYRGIGWAGLVMSLCLDAARRKQ
jgi:hypothetical protein